jgi:DNA processing protein
MTGLPELVALSLSPSSSWRAACDRLRAGDPPAAVLLQLSRGSSVRSSAADGAAALTRGAARGVSALGWNDPAYPAALAAISDPPFVLWIRGRPDALARPAVALVGSRAASEQALAVARRLGSDLAEAGLTIVSGLARGVDQAAHQGALDAGGVTVAVLGSGADIVYPREHAQLARTIERTGALVSELVPGTPPLARFFPRRNRIISGLSRAVVVVEAGEKSGSLITARAALEQGRDVLAVPGPVLGGRNRGAHALLRDGARIVETAADVLEELGLPSPGGPLRSSSAPSDPILACLAPGEACDLDAIADRSGLTTTKLLPRLLALELAGAIRRAGGGRFVRVDSSC